MWCIFIVFFGVFEFERIDVDSLYYYHGIWAAEINGDNRIDILAGRRASGHAAIWFEQTANINNWIPHLIDTVPTNPVE